MSLAAHSGARTNEGEKHMSFVDKTGLLAGSELELLGDGSVLAEWAEGPVWLPEQAALRYSDIPGNRILQWSAATGLVSVYREGVEFTNGRTTGLEGEVIQCSHGNRWVEVDRGDEPAPLVSDWHGRRFNSPNDVIVKSDGTIWFSDPSYGIFRGREGHPGRLEYRDHWVFRLDPVTCECEPVIMDVEMPNGLAFSPDESLLYSSDNSIDLPSEEPNPDGTHAIRVYKVIDGRLCKGGRLRPRPGRHRRWHQSRRTRQCLECGVQRRPRVQPRRRRDRLHSLSRGSRGEPLLRRRRRYRPVRLVHHAGLPAAHHRA